MPKVGTIDYTTRLADIKTILDVLDLEAEHESFIWPEGTDEVVTCTAGAVASAFSSWVELDIDGDGDTLSSKLTDAVCHISALIIEDLSDDDEVYDLEIAYGDDKTNIGRHRFLSGEAKKLSGVMYLRIRAPEIPAGETVYYRMKCSKALATCEIHVRYHLH